MDLRGIGKDVLKVLSKYFKRKLTKVSDIGLDIPPGLSKKFGKIGVITTHNGKVKKIINDKRYVSDPDYRKYVRETGYTPEWIRKVSHSRGKSVNLESKVKNMIGKVPVSKLRSSNIDKYMNAIKVGSANNKVNYTMIKNSVTRLIKEGASSDSLKRSVEQGLRLGALAKDSIELKGKLCRITETSSENPDDEHRFLEGVVMSCDKAMKYLSRFGCQHDYEVLDQK